MRKEAPATAAPSLAIWDGARKEGAPAVASLPKGEDKALSAAYSPPAAESSRGAAGKREEGAPAAASRLHAAEPSGDAAGKREEEAAGAAGKRKEEAADAVKVKTPPAAKLRPAASVAAAASGRCQEQI
ncbi:hypothetical protein GUJ93_ZPchr0002g23072 [Zizania palustris]|uniref:Uncharacterized protein n=1 Tax=Zizania palustris TaxID=103762 RepID=A0A8J5SBR0_ZIZPA|nr:hypothetical protein GUJ93_ZPchr0002g23072 [Zizania palustris]